MWTIRPLLQLLLITRTIRPLLALSAETFNTGASESYSRKRDHSDHTTLCGALARNVQQGPMRVLLQLLLITRTIRPFVQPARKTSALSACEAY
jgi:hypothetical protein